MHYRNQATQRSKSRKLRNMSPVSVAILAGGQSRRMGCNKAFLELGSSTVLEKIIAAVTPLTVEIMLIADKTGDFARFGLPVFPDLNPGLGPIGGLHTALVHAPSEVMLILACDLPFLKTEFLYFLVGSLQNHQAVVPRNKKGLEHLCAIYTRSCLTAVKSSIARQQLHMASFHQDLDIRILEPAEWQTFDSSQTLFLNLNAPADYQRAQTLVEEESP